MTDTKDSKAAVRLIPGQALGPLHIGMSRGDLAKVGFEVKPHPSGQLGDNVRVVGPYQIVLDGDRVASIEVKLGDLPGGVSVAGRAIAAGASLEQLTKLLPDCRPAEAREGGTVVVCGGGTTLIKVGLEEHPAVELQIVAPGFLPL